LKKDFEDELDKNSSKEIPPSSLDKKIQNLIELICNVTEMEKALKEMKYDSQKAPLGKLSKNQIKLGYAALKEIEDLIAQNKHNSGQAIIQANNDFYSRIPHDLGIFEIILFNLMTFLNV
jgi:poly [ADP-ribose] polymerase